MKGLQQYKNKVFKDKAEVLKEYKRLEPRYKIVREVLKYRIKENITQNELAKKIGTKQSNISRLENGNYNPSLAFLNKLAKALGKELHITFK